MHAFLGIAGRALRALASAFAFASFAFASFVSLPPVCVCVRVDRSRRHIRNYTTWAAGSLPALKLLQESNRTHQRFSLV